MNTSSSEKPCLSTPSKSDAVPSLKAIRRKRLIVSGGEGEERMLARRSWSHRHSKLLGVSCFVIVVTVAMVSACLWGGSDTSSTVLTGSLLLGVAGILASIVGLLFVAIMFGIRSHHDRLGIIRCLSQYLIIEMEIAPAVSLCLAIIGANIFVPLTVPFATEKVIASMVLLDMFLVLFVLWVTFSLFYRMVMQASGDRFYNELLPALCYDYRKVLDIEAHQAIANRELKEHASGIGVELSDWPVYHFRDVDEAQSAVYRVRADGCIFSIDTDRLKNLAALISSAAPPCKIILSAAIGERVDHKRVLWLISEDSRSLVSRSDVALKSEAIERELRKVIKVTRRRSVTTPRELGELQNALADGATQATPEEFERGLDVVRSLIELNLAHPYSASLRPPDVFNHAAGIPTDPYFKIGRAVVAQQDHEKIRTLMLFAGRIMVLAAKDARADWFLNASQITESIYLQSGQHEGMGRDVADRLGSFMDAIKMELNGFNILEKDSIPVNDEQDPVMRATLGWVLRLIKAAIEGGRWDDASYFLGQMLLDRLSTTAMEPESCGARQHANNAKRYALVVVAGWCIRLLREGRADASDVAPVMTKISKSALCREEFLRAWESQGSPRAGARMIHPSRWPRDDQEYRPGVIVSGMADEGWVEEGFLALLMAARGRPYRAKWFTEPPSIDLPAAGHVEAVCDKVIGDKELCGVLGIMDKEAEPRKVAVMELFAQRRRLAKLKALRDVVTPPVVESRVADLAASIEKHLQERPWSTIIAGLGCSEEAGESFCDGVDTPGWFLKEALVGDGTSFDYDSDQIAEKLLRLDQLEVEAWLLEIATSSGIVVDLGRIAAQVKAAVAQLQDAGYSPSLLVIPNLPRFSYALLGMDAVRVTRRDRITKNHLGTWEGIEVFSSATGEFRGILISDCSQLLGKLEADPLKAFSLEVTNDRHEEHEDFVKAAEEGTTEDDVRSPSDVYVDVRMGLRPAIGLRDKEAMLKLELDLTGVGYAMLDSDDLYHRPTCPQLSGKSPEYALTVPIGSSRQPCSECAPEMWPDDFIDWDKM